MATVTTLSSAARGSDARGRAPYLVQNSIDFGAAATAKGTGGTNAKLHMRAHPRAG